MTPDDIILWQPPAHVWQTSRIGNFAAWLERRGGPKFEDYETLWRWSISDIGGFWQALWDYMKVETASPIQEVVQWSEVGDAKWFSGVAINYAQHVLREVCTDEAIAGISQTRARITWTGQELKNQVARCRTGLVRLGVGKGDRVAAYLPNIPEAIAAFLATASLGAIWTSCPPEFGIRSVLDRFVQVEPKVLLTVDGYSYGDRPIEMLERVTEIQSEIPSLRQTVLLPYLRDDVPEDWTGETWQDFTAEATPILFELVPFDHPLYILYSSGTTGLPKAIVHGHGGILLEHFKNLGLHLDVGAGDRFFWFSTTGWMMWNLLVSGLIMKATIVTFDGNPAWPDAQFLWRLAAQERLTFFGVSASYLASCQRDGVDPRAAGDFASLRSIGSTGSPLPAETARWVYQMLPSRIQLGSGSGGTDICSGFVGGVPLQPVYADAMSCRYLGASVEAFDQTGRSVVDTLGELVITRPMPSMPVRFWNDPDGARYQAAYFNTYPGVWRHGDWITIHSNGSCTIHGRSDATLNRGGVRLGTAEFYGVVEALPEIVDSLVVHIESTSGGLGELILFVATREPSSASQTLRDLIVRKIRKQLSPRHVPDSIYFVASVPRTLSGKKLEVPVKKIILGATPDSVISRGTVSDPRAIEDLLAILQERQTVNARLRKLPEGTGA